MIIMPHPYGQMANRLILASTFIAHAEETGNSFLHLAFADYFRYFEGTRHNPVIFYRSTTPQQHRKDRMFGCVNIWNTHDKRGETYWLHEDHFLSLEQRSRCLFVIGWSFRTQHSVKHRDLLRRLFTPISRHRDAVAKLVEAARPRSGHLVGVHIRQTDYRKFLNGKYFYPLSVYRRVMDELAAQLNSPVRFLLCSDAPVDKTAFRGLDIISATGHPVEDNYALAACDYIVGPPSTYTAWASFYGQVPKRFILSADDPIFLDSFDIQETI